MLTIGPSKESMKKAAINKFANLISMNPVAFYIGKVVQAESCFYDFTEKLVENLEVIFGLKSAAILNKRANALFLYVKASVDQNKSPFPIREADVASYFFQLRGEGNFTSRASTFRESWRFCHYTLGLEGALEACNSARVKGASDSMLAEKKTWHPADPFTVEEAQTFHRHMDDASASIFDRLASGRVLAMIYGRCRASDLNAIETVHQDFDANCGYLELGTTTHKTAKKAHLKTKLLPIVIPAFGVTGDCWAKKFMAIRAAAGIGPHASRTPLTPAPMISKVGTVDWSTRPLDSGEITEFIRRVLNPSESSCRKLSSHSCKATALSWLAKFGTHREDRDVLGRHVSAIEGAGPLYSRDLISSPLRQLDKVIMLIRDGKFRPDAGRSGMIVVDADNDHVLVLSSDDEQPSKKAKSGPIEVKDEPDWTEVFNQWDWEELSKSSSSSDTESSGDEAIALNSSSMTQVADVMSEGLEAYRHRTSRLVHACESTFYEGLGYRYTRCGRKVSQNFEKLDECPKACVTCSHCFRK